MRGRKPLRLRVNNKVHSSKQTALALRTPCYALATKTSFRAQDARRTSSAGVANGSHRHHTNSAITTNAITRNAPASVGSSGGV